MDNNKFLRVTIFTLGLILFLDGLILILLKKIHLGTLLPLLIGFIFCITVIFSKQIHSWLNQHLKVKQLWLLGWRLFGLWLMTLISFFIYIHFKTQQNTTIPNLQAIIVLGSGITQGQATPTLAKRLDAAGQLANQQKGIPIVVSGGLDYGEIKTEAEVMANYLQTHFHIENKRILQEDKSTSTDLNLKNSLPLLNAHHLGLDSKIAIVTSDFHTLRAAAIAHKQGYKHFVTVGAETPLTTRYNAWLREYFAYISGWILGEY